MGKKNGIVSMLGRLRILNHQSFSKSDIHSDFLDFNGKCLSMSFFIPKKFLTKNVITTELMYVELEDFEIDAMEFDDFTDPNEKNIQLSIQPIKYFILDSNGKTVLNIPDLEKLVIEINDESSIKKNFSEKVYSHYKNRTKNQDDATTNRDDESIMSFATYNTDFCNSPMIEQVKNRNLSIKPSFQEIEPSSTLNQNKIMNVYNRSQQMDLSKSTSDVFLPLSQKQPKQSEDLYSSIDYGRRHENAAFQIEKVVQKVRPMQEIPPKRCNIQIERIQTTNTSVPVVQNKRVVKNPRTKRIEALRQDVYDAIDDGGVSPVIPYQSFISQEREKRKRLLQNKNFDEIIPDSEDFTLEDNFDTDEKLIPTVAKKSKNKKVPVKKVTQVKSSTKAAPKRAMQTRSKKETAPKKLKTAKENITPPKISLKPAAKTKKQPKNHREPPIMMNESKTIEKTTRRVIFSSSSSEDHFKPLQNHADNDDESDMDMDVVIHPKAPIVAIEQLMAAKKKREEMMKMQKIEKMKNSMYPYFPVIKPLKDHSVEIVKKTTKQKPRTARKAKYISSSENNFEPLQNHADNDDESDMDMDVVIHPKAPIEAIESLITSKKHRVELNKTQEVEKMKKTKKPNFPVLKPLINHPVEIVKQATEQKPRDTEYNHKCLGDKIEKIDSVHIVRNVTFTTRVSPGSSQLIQNNQDCVQRAKKRINKRMDDVDEIIQYHDMEVDNPQVQNNVQRTRVVSTDKRDLSLEYDNEHYKRMKPSISSNTQNITYDPPINYNFDQLRSNKLLNKFISQTNNNETDQQHYKESVTVQRTTTIQQRVSIDQSPSKETQIINRTNFKVGKEDLVTLFFF